LGELFGIDLRVGNRDSLDALLREYEEQPVAFTA
jgi:hypothetical protein